MSELKEAVQEEWKKIPLMHVQKLVRSVSTHVKMVIKARVFATKYLEKLYVFSKYGICFA